MSEHNYAVKARNFKDSDDYRDVTRDGAEFETGDEIIVQYDGEEHVGLVTCTTPNHGTHDYDYTYHVHFPTGEWPNASGWTNIRPENALRLASEDEEDETPHSDELVQKLVDSFNSHGFSRDHAEICNDVCVWIEFSGKTHRGTMKNCEGGVFQTARRLGWYPKGIRWEEDRVLFRRNRDETEDSE